MGHTFSKLEEWVLLDGDWEKLKVWMAKKRLDGIAVTDICVQARVDRTTFYRWWNRYQAEGKDGLKEKTGYASK
jgi:transposase-like protein